MKKVALSLLALFFLVLLAASPETRPEHTLPGPSPQSARAAADGTQAIAHLNFLASDAMKGRRSGTPEYQRAAEYVAVRFQEYGLRPGGENGGWFQQVPIPNFREFVPPVQLAIISPSRRVYFAGRGRDFQPIAGTGSGIARGHLAFAGYGVVSDPAGWNDYAGLDVTGRIVMILAGVPPGADEEERRTWTLERKVAAAAARGALGLIEMDPSVPGQQLRTVQRPSAGLPKGTCPPAFLVFRAGVNFSDDAFYVAGRSWRDHASRMLRERRPAPLAIDTTVEMEVHAVWEERTAPNVIGVLPGADPALAGEYLVIGAHLDHVGVGVDGFTYNGADDNASGVATVLEVARLLQVNGFKPRRTAVLCAWAGEEMGLLGSAWYANHPLFPLEKTALYLNMDMVGTGDTDLWVGGLYEFRELFDLIRGGLDPAISEKLHARLQYRGSDHTSFRSKGVPWISLRTGHPLTSELDDEHPEYHRPGDRREYIRPELLALAADYHYQILTHLANTDRALLDPQFFTRFMHRDATIADMHCDTIGRYMDGEDLAKDLPSGHIDIPKLREGSVDLQVFAAYVAVPRNETEKVTAAKRAFDQIDAIHRLVAANPNDLSLVLDPSQVEPLKAENKTGVLIGIEGGYAIENNLALLRTFHRSGVRLMTLTHWNRTDWADASGDEKAELGGLTAFGEEVVREMNRLGMIVDISHVHDETFWDVMRVSTKPVVASHSCARALSDHFRNLSDDMLKALAKNGGVMGINFLPGFLVAELERKESAAAAAIAKKYGLAGDPGQWQAADQALRDKAMAELRRAVVEIRSSLPPVDVGTVVDHIEHVIKVTGSADHAGLGSDYDGISSTPRGLEHIGKIGAITEELRARGHSEQDIRKILGGNFMRVFGAVSRTGSGT